MATEYGNNFSNNSGKYSFKTTGHKESDTDYVIVSSSDTAYVYPSNTQDIINNTTTYGSNYPTTYYVTRPTNSLYVAYIVWPENRNKQGSISGTFTSYVDVKYNTQPEFYDDNFKGVSTNGETLTPYREALKFVATRDTRGYRKSNVSFQPRIVFNKSSYDNGYSTYSSTNTNTELTFNQTFLNEREPKGLLSWSVTNHDNVNSTSPVMCTISNPSTYYGNNFSYAYSTYNDSAKYQYTTTFNITYNKLPLFPKQLVMTYDTKYNTISYDGDTLNVEAKALYGGTYQGFTTSNIVDTGFTSYVRYADITYNYKVFNSSTTPSGINTYIFRIYQPASKLGISYNWSIDGNPSWAHLSTTSGNKTTITIDDVNDDKPSVGGKLVLNLPTTEFENNHGTTGTISGNTWVGPTNKSARSCTIRQKMSITNCIAQNVTPKDTDGMPVNTFVLSQNGMTWNNPSFTSYVGVRQVTKDTTTYNDSYDHGWPVIWIGGGGSLLILDESKQLGYQKWGYSYTSKNVFVVTPKIETPWVNTYSGGVVTVSYNTSNVAYTGDTRTITLTPSITFRQGFTSGVSERTWTIYNEKNVNTEEEYGSVSTFDDVTIKLKAIPATNHTYGDATVSWSNTPTTISNYKSVTLDSTSKTWNNDNSTYSFNATFSGNLPTIGTWSATADSGLLTFTSTTKNAVTKYAPLTFSGNTYQDGTVTVDPSTIVIPQNGTKISGGISISYTGTGMYSCPTSAVYPIDGYNVYGSYTLASPLQLYVTGAGTLGVSISNIANPIPYNTAGTLKLSITGSHTEEDASSKTLPWSISASSSIVSTYPSNHTNGVIASGNVVPNSTYYMIRHNYYIDGKLYTSNENTPNRVYYYGMPTNYASVVSAWLTHNSNSGRNILNGYYDYHAGYHVPSNSKTYKFEALIYDYNSGITYTGGSDSIIQSGDPDTSAISGTFTFTTTGTNCSPTTPSGVSGTSDQSNVGKFSLSSVTSPVSNPSGNSGSSSSPATYIYNYDDQSSSRRYSTSPSVNFTHSNGQSIQFNAGDSISFTFGVSSSTNSIVCYHGNKVWNYQYQYGVKSSSESSYNYSGWLVAAGSTNVGNTTLVRHIEGTNGTITSTGTYTCKVYYTDPWNGAKCFGDYTCTIYVNKYSWKYKVSASGGGSITHTAFDSNPNYFSLSVSASGQRSGNNGASWESYSVSYSWSGCSTSGSSSSATATLSASSSGTSANSGTVTCTVKCGDASTTVTWTLYNYGKTYYNV